MTKHAKKKFAKHHTPGLERFFVPMGIALTLIVVAVIYVMTFDIEAYRSQIVVALSSQTGREVKVDGPMAWHFSFSRGLRIGLKDVSVSNPSWASRPVMAEIGHVGLRVNALKLLSRRLEIVSIDVGQAQVQLERNAQGQSNWVFVPKPMTPPEEEIVFFKTQPKKEKPKELPPLSLAIEDVLIEQSRFGLRTDDGELLLFDVPRLTFNETDTGIRTHFRGTWAALPVELDFVGGSFATLNEAEWPFNLGAYYAGMDIEASGRLSDHMKKVVIDNFQATAGKSTLTGQLEVELEHQRPFMKGVIKGSHFALRDLQLAADEQAELSSLWANLAEVSPLSGGHLFSHRPMELDILKRFDADLSVSLDELVWGLTPFKNLETKMSLNDGQLVLSPFAIDMAGSRVQGLVKANVKERAAQIVTVLKGKNLEFSKLLDLGGMESMISGKVDLEMALQTQGRSSYEFASHANGAVNLLMDTGTFSTSGLQSVIGSLVDWFLPGASMFVSPGINCMAARYKVTNGFVETKGLLIDMDSTTMSGTGTVNLPDEHINMDLQTRPKSVGVAAIVPPMRIYGDLTSPNFSFDTNGLLQKMTGLLTMNKNAHEPVPSMLHMEGHNDCAVTLDNLAMAYQQDGRGALPLVPGDSSMTDGLKTLGAKLLGGIGNAITGN